MDFQLTPDQQRAKEQIDATMTGFARAAQALVPALQRFSETLNEIKALMDAGMVQMAAEEELYPEAFALAREYYAWREELGLDECLQSVRFGMVPPTARCGGLTGSRHTA